MYLINETYFTKSRYIPNIQSNISDDLITLTEFIDSESRLLLKNVLGYLNFKDLDQYIDVNGDLVGATQKWIDFVNGVEYTYNNEIYKWNGLLFQEGAQKESLIADYVFCKWLENEQSQMSGVGEVVINAQNAINVSGIERHVRVWNDFVMKYQGNYSYNVQPTYWFKNGIRVTDWTSNYNGYVSMLEYLTHKEADFEPIPFKQYETINQFGL